MPQIVDKSFQSWSLFNVSMVYMLFFIVSRWFNCLPKEIIKKRNATFYGNIVDSDSDSDQEDRKKKIKKSCSRRLNEMKKKNVAQY